MFEKNIVELLFLYYNFDRYITTDYYGILDPVVQTKTRSGLELKKFRIRIHNLGESHQNACIPNWKKLLFEKIERKQAYISMYGCLFSAFILIQFYSTIVYLFIE